MHASYGVVSAWADLCRGNPSPVSVALHYLITEGRLKEALEYSVDATRYSDPKAFAVDYMLTNFAKKSEEIDVGIDREKVCIDTWKSTEDACRLTNRRFSAEITSLPSEAHRILHAAARKISRVLGPLKLGSMFARSEWSGGSTYDVSRRRAAFDNKMLSKLTVSRSALKYARAYLETDYHWFAALTGSFPGGPYCVLDDNFTVVDAARSCTVPKSYKTDRFISIEPTMNVFLQKGVGAYIRGRLRSVGVDLDDQTGNQSACARAHVDNLATVDLKSASDTVSKELVYHLLPYEWASLLDDLRSKAVELSDGTKYRLEKFSSMGNGFTFELESLIFWAISASVCGDDSDSVRVYGDDIIVPRRHYDDLCNILLVCGFSVNKEKSFASGSFYESCGKHFFNGVDVTPIYQKKAWLVKGKQFEPEMIRAYNRLVRWHMRVWGQWRSARIRVLLERLYNGSRHLVPIGTLGDDGYLRPVSHFATTDRNHGIYCHVLVRTQKVRQANGEAGIALYLRRSKVHPFSGDNCDSVSLADVAIGNGAYRTRHRWVNLQLGALIG